MIWVLVTVVVLFVLWMNMDFPMPSFRRKPIQLTPEQRLTTGGRVVLKQFRRLPEENRPYDEEELITALLALDVKWGVKTVNNHFMGYVGYYYDGKYCPCSGPDDCRFTDHADLLTAIKKIQDALEKRKHDLALAGVEADLSRVTDLTMRLHQEADIVESVTERLK